MAIVLSEPLAHHEMKLLAHAGGQGPSRKNQVKKRLNSPIAWILVRLKIATDEANGSRVVIDHLKNARDAWAHGLQETKIDRREPDLQEARKKGGKIARDDQDSS